MSIFTNVTLHMSHYAPDLQDISIGKERAKALLNGDIDKATKLTVLEKAFDTIFCHSKKQQALNAIKEMNVFSKVNTDDPDGEILNKLSHNLKELQELTDPRTNMQRIEQANQYFEGDEYLSLQDIANNTSHPDRLKKLNEKFEALRELAGQGAIGEFHKREDHHNVTTSFYMANILIAKINAVKGEMQVHDIGNGNQVLKKDAINKPVELPIHNLELTSTNAKEIKELEEDIKMLNEDNDENNHINDVTFQPSSLNPSNMI
ncbi:hypothetical protein [uncultured Shewanella sp.]|uniref:hypothetical protein n=1 Tax=uncultured Shewanella sp. TaxID=173975 RepID=UPI00260A8CA5|nr:hypothetical protein [uncultured Shewanella sp.]